MSIPAACPTQLGCASDLDAPSARLHACARRGKLREMKRALAQGADPDVLNSAGQSPLFTAALLGHASLVTLLLRSGADPNLRCTTGSTPVHAASFACFPGPLAKLLDAGGDLRLRDREGRSPEDWAQAASQRKNRQMLGFLRQCRMEMARLVYQGESTMGQRTLRSCSSSQLLRPRSSLLRQFQLRFSHSDTSWSLAGSHSLGFGKLCRCGSHGLGVAGSTPIVGERELVRPDSERDVSYANGPFTMMRNRVWDGQRVTVRELKPPSHSHCSKPQGPTDLLIAEQHHCSHLHHPNLLLLMSVCVSESLEQVHLVYERVEIGSLYTVLHKRRSELAGLGPERFVRLLFQVSEALVFLHSRGYLHRSLSSHAVQLITMDNARLSNLEYLQESSAGLACSNVTPVTVPHQLYNWLPPEIIWGNVGSVRSDIYSFCTVIQEVFTDTVPWSGLDGLMVKEMMNIGRSLALDTRVPPFLHSIVQTGISLRQRDRSINLQDIRLTLRNQLPVLGPSPGSGVGRRATCPTQVPRLGSPGPGPAREQAKAMDTMDGYGPKGSPCQSMVAGASEEMCYYEVDLSSSQSYYSMSSQEQGREGRTLAAGSEPHTPRGRSNIKERVLEESEREADGSRRSDSSSSSSRCSLEVDGIRNQTPHPRGERLRVYSVRLGREIHLESDSSLLLESVSGSTSGEREGERETAGEGERERDGERETEGEGERERDGERETEREGERERDGERETEREPSQCTHPSPRLSVELAVKPSNLPGSPAGPSDPLPDTSLHRPAISFLTCADTIQESASLLVWANSSLERLERRFLSGIQALEQVAGSQWEPAHQERDRELELERELGQDRELELELDRERDRELGQDRELELELELEQEMDQDREQDWELELEQNQSPISKHTDKVTGFSAGESSCGVFHQLQDMTDDSARVPGIQEPQTLGATESHGSSGVNPRQRLTIQGSVGAMSVCQFLDRCNLRCSDQPTFSTDCKLQTFNLMQEIIDELNGVTNAGRGKVPSTNHQAKAATQPDAAPDRPRVSPEQPGESSTLADLSAGSEGKGQPVLGTPAETPLSAIDGPSGSGETGGGRRALDEGYRPAPSCPEPRGHTGQEQGRQCLSGESRKELGSALETLGSAAEIPGSALETLGSAAEIPGSALETPGSAAEIPGSALETPGSVVETPVSALETPGSALEIPGSALETPGSVVETPGSAVEIPGSALEIPGSALEIPGSALEIPGSALEIPGSLFETLGSALEIPGALLDTGKTSGSQRSQDGAWEEQTRMRRCDGALAAQPRPLGQGPWARVPAAPARGRPHSLLGSPPGAKGPTGWASARPTIAPSWVWPPHVHRHPTQRPEPHPPHSTHQDRRREGAPSGNGTAGPK